MFVVRFQVDILMKDADHKQPYITPDAADLVYKRTAFDLAYKGSTDDKWRYQQKAQDKKKQRITAINDLERFHQKLHERTSIVAGNYDKCVRKPKCCALLIGFDV